MCLPVDGAPARWWACHHPYLEEQEVLLAVRVLRSRPTRSTLSRMMLLSLYQRWHQRCGSRSRWWREQHVMCVHVPVQLRVGLRSVPGPSQLSRFSGAAQQRRTTCARPAAAQMTCSCCSGNSSWPYGQ